MGGVGIYSPIQSTRIKGSAGKALPTVFQTLADKGAHFIRGHLVLVVASPGTGKSAFTLTEALRSGVPTFYFSADSDSHTQTARTLSILSGDTLQGSARALLNHEWGRVDAYLNNVPVRWSYDASPSLDTIDLELRAYIEAYGEYPQLVVVDNVTNVLTESEDGDDDPFQGLEGLMDYLHGVSRETGACVIGLHHTTGSYNDADKPVPLSGLKGQIGRVPEMVLTLFKPSDETIGVSVPKNRSGKVTNGWDYAELEFDADRMLIRDPPTPTVGGSPFD